MTAPHSRDYQTPGLKLHVHRLLVVPIAVALVALLAGAADSVPVETTSTKRVRTYTLLNGPVESPPIVLPLNKPVLVMVTSNTYGNGGLASVTIIRTASEPFLWWTGLSGPNAGNLLNKVNAIVGDFGSAPGYQIATINYDGTLWIAVHDQRSIVIHNDNSHSGLVTGTITLIF
jgi:hypothetical protein